ncbi:MAG: lysophospholipid acyltransferase family protein [Planctomycetota bacterium]|nr:lysophospholipid acyltransferase family protein [Planctomycetota bacterium]
MEPGANWFYFLSRAVAGFFCWILFRPSRQGVEKVPESGGFLLAVNHSSLLDPVVAGTQLVRPLAFMARSTLFRPALIGMALKGMNALPLEREGVGISAFRSVIDHLSRGGGVLVFPEGTRSRSGRLGRFKGGVVKLARMSGVTVIPAMIVGSDRALGRGRWIPQPVHVEIRFGDPIDVLDPKEDTSDALARIRKAMVRLAPECEGEDQFADEMEN